MKDDKQICLTIGPIQTLHLPLLKNVWFISSIEPATNQIVFYWSKLFFFRYFLFSQMRKLDSNLRSTGRETIAVTTVPAIYLSGVPYN